MLGNGRREGRMRVARQTVPYLKAWALPDAEFALRVTPRAATERMVTDGDGAGGAGRLQVWVNAPPAEGRANEAARRLLARALGVAPTRLALVSGAHARDKRFRLLPPG